MFCAGCGAVIGNDFTRCPECGRPVETPVATARAAQLAAYAATIRKLGLWFVLFAALNAGLGAAGLIGGLAEHGHILHPFEPWPHPPLLQWTYMGTGAWVLLIIRAVLAFLGGAALRVQAPWARRLAVLAALLAVTQFPIGLLFGTYALVRLMGPRNAALYSAVAGGTGEARRKLQVH